MADIESLIKVFAIGLGIITLSAPIIAVASQARRPKGLASGTAAASRSWVGALLLAAGLVGIGFLLWKPVPIEFSNQVGLLLSVAGASLYFPGVCLYLWALVTLGSEFGVSGLLGAELYQEHKLITHGPFGIIRHPMYAGVILAAVGSLLIFRTWALVVFLPLSLVVLGRAKREENLLAQAFGDRWRAYAAEVPKWFPRW